MKHLLSFYTTYIAMAAGSIDSQMYKKVKAPLPVIVLHWALAIAVVFCFFTGQRIAADRKNLGQTSVHLYSWWLDTLPQGAVFDLHRSSAWLLVFSLTAYLVFIFLSGRFRYLNFRKHNPRAKKWNNGVIWLGLGLGLLQIASGFFLNKEISSAAQSVAMYWSNAKNVHALVSWAIIAYIALHIFSIVVAKGPSHLFALFRASRSRLHSANIALVAALIIAFIVTRIPNDTLVVAVTHNPPIVDGYANDDIWQATKSLTITTRYGNPIALGTPDSGTTSIPVEIKAAHDNERLYLLLRWPDNEPSNNHLPLIKKNAGWIIQSDGFAQDNEESFYEDKLAVMLSNHSRLDAVRSIHLGDQPLTNAPPARHGRGYHYTTQGQILDIWQWKAVRSDPLRQADDSHFGPAKTPLACSPRYTAGYSNDPSLGGGYRGNYDYFKDRYSDTVTPLRISLSANEILNKSWMRWSDGKNFNNLLDEKISVNSQLPGIINHGPMEGDRGDVGARGHWENGYWHLEMSRALQSNSTFDTTIQPGTFLWVAVFNHAQTRHSYHLWPITLNW